MFILAAYEYAVELECNFFFHLVTDLRGATPLGNDDCCPAGSGRNEGWREWEMGDGWRKLGRKGGERREGDGGWIEGGRELGMEGGRWGMDGWREGGRARERSRGRQTERLASLLLLDRGLQLSYLEQKKTIASGKPPHAPGKPSPASGKPPSASGKPPPASGNPSHAAGKPPPASGKPPPASGKRFPQGRASLRPGKASLSNDNLFFKIVITWNSFIDRSKRWPYHYPNDPRTMSYES